MAIRRPPTRRRRDPTGQRRPRARTLPRRLPRQTRWTREPVYTRRNLWLICSKARRRIPAHRGRATWSIRRTPIRRPDHPAPHPSLPPRRTRLRTARASIRNNRSPIFFPASDGGGARVDVCRRLPSICLTAAKHQIGEMGVQAAAARTGRPANRRHAKAPTCEYLAETTPRRVRRVPGGTTVRFGYRCARPPTRN